MAQRAADRRCAPAPRSVPVSAAADTYLLVQGVPAADSDVGCSRWDGSLKAWDGRALAVRGGACANTRAAMLHGHTDWVMAHAVLPDGRAVS